jgi:predicted lipid-binding transport protein (Tim44 family)
MAGGLAGGFLGSMLFSSFAGAGSHGGGSYGGSSGGGFPIMDIILLAALAYGAYWFFIKRKRQQTQGSNPTSYSNRLDTPAYSPPSPGAAAFDIPSQDTAPPPPPPPPPPPIPGQGQGQDMAQGLAQIQMMDPQFNEALFREQATDIFFQVQSAWTGLKLEPARGVLTPEMFDVLAAQVTQMKEQGRVNRLENIAMRGVEMAEAWQEQGYDYITLRLTANLLDYTVDAKGGQVLEGSDSLPVKFEEYWTFARPVGSGPWQVAAITQVN